MQITLTVTQNFQRDPDSKESIAIGEKLHKIHSLKLTVHLKIHG